MENSPISTTPFAVLTTLVAPAILTNACTVLALGTSNRIARVIDRTRFLTAEMEKLTPEMPAYKARTHQLERLRTRAAMLFRALRILYAALGGFAAAALITVVGSILAYYDVIFEFHATAILGLAVGAFSVTSLVYGCSLLVREIRLALIQVREEVEEVVGQTLPM